jgi:regulator of sigma E protease
VVAKLCGVLVNEFSIGVGPLLFQRQGRETKFSLRLVPLMAYCALEGEGESDNPRAFTVAPPWKRFLILAAGSTANLLLGLLIVLMMYAPVKTYATTTITGFAQGCPAQGEEWLLEGDKILSINGKGILLYNDITTLLSLDQDEKVDMVVQRGEKRIRLDQVPLGLREYEEKGQKVLRYGLNFGIEEAGPLERLRYGFYYTVDFARMTFWGLEMLFNGTVGMKDLQGPVGVVGTMNSVGKSAGSVLGGLLNVLYLGAFISVNVGVMNLLPFPGLDGGQIVLLVINTLSEKLFRRKVPLRVQQYLNLAGLVLLLGLGIVVAFHDVFKLIQR